MDVNMFLGQIDKNRKEAFERLVERKGQDKSTVFVDDEGYYCYRTKRGLLKTFVAFDSFIKYKKSDFYPEKPEQVNGFYFVPLIRNGGKTMKNIWLYEVFGKAWGVVKADNKEEAEQKVRDAYKKRDPSFDEYRPIIIKAYNEENNWFSDSPDVLEVYE